MFTRGIAALYNGVMPEAFQSSRIPQVFFRAGALAELPAMVRSFGYGRVGVVTGSSWFPASEAWATLHGGLEDRGCAVLHETTTGEPAPRRVDEIAAGFREGRVDAVIGIGGGSVLDAAKASAAAFHLEHPVREYLEGVGSYHPEGRTLPVIAVPTTAGTGSEATKNAVLSEVGGEGFKKSLRHDNYIPQVALIDPELAASASPEVTAASGLDAVTQLLEAYISTKASIFTDAMAETGLRLAGRSFIPVVQDGDNHGARGDMAYAAFLSGVCLANAGLGIVHGAASPAGALSSVPHGVFCGTMLLPAMRYTVERLSRIRETKGRAATKLARAAHLLSDTPPGPELQLERAAGGAEAVTGAMNLLIDRLNQFMAVSPLPRLGEYGITESVVDRIAAKTGLKNHPVEVSQKDVRVMLMEHL